MKPNQILKIYGSDYQKMTMELLKASDLAGMIPDYQSRIMIKPNLVVPCPAVTGATTHPEIVAGLIEYLRAHGFLNIVIAEGCWIGEKTEDCLEYTGFRKLCEDYHIPFIDIRKYPVHEKDCGGMRLKISDIVEEIDFLINVPVVKGHCQVKMTCALKNIKGLVPDDEKRRFHQLGIHRPVGHLTKGIRQDFILADHICGDLAFEEGGHPIHANCIMTALDPVLMDAYVCKILELLPEEVPYLLMAEQLGVGTTDLDSAEIIELNHSENDGVLPKTSGILDVAYAAEALEACSACYANLIPAMISLSEEGLLEKLNTKIAIGQAHQGRKGKLGVGKCTAGFETCVMGCPPNSEKIYRTLKDYILQSDFS